MKSIMYFVLSVCLYYGSYIKILCSSGRQRSKGKVAFNYMYGTHLKKRKELYKLKYVIKATSNLMDVSETVMEKSIAAKSKVFG